MGRKINAGYSLAKEAHLYTKLIFNNILIMDNTLKGRIVDLLETEEIQKIINSEEFYFLKARKALDEFLKYENSELIDEIYYWEYQKLRESSREDVKELLQLIDSLVAYCDLRAYNKITLNEYEDKRVLAQANIRQNAWIRQLLLYKKDKTKCTRPIRNTINYILKPEANINILSEDHRSMISQLLFKKEYNSDNFVTDVCNYFQELNISFTNPINKTHLYSRLIYKLKDIWCNIIKGLVARDTTDWRDELGEEFRDGAKYSISWWHELPSNKTEILRGLRKTIEKEGHFDFYYVQNNQAVYKAKVEDFVEASEYSQKVNEWKKKSPIWFDESLEVYNDKNKKAKILFLFSSFESLQDPFPIESFEMYKGNDLPVRSHLGVFSCIEQIEINMMKEELELETKILLQKKQIILQGAPGTGKTYSTAALALSILGVSFDPNNHEEMMKRYKEYIDKKQIYFTTFHQSMGYEDFVEGLKPTIAPNNKDVVYKVEDGIFKNICLQGKGLSFENQYSLLLDELKKAPLSFETKTDHLPFKVKSNSANNLTISSGKNLSNGDSATSITVEKLKEKNPQDNNSCYINVIRDYMEKIQQPYPRVLIIDEINRGNISKIFGELITLLEADKRKDGEHPISVILPYSTKEFMVPSNIYIIGTMNTTDRSTGRIDYAIRRRFAFYTLEADLDAIASFYAEKEALGDKAKNLFNAIKQFVNDHKVEDMEMEELMIGHSYFLADTLENLTLKFRYDIVPLLKEYEKDGMLLSSNQLNNKIKEWENLLD